MRPLFAAVSVGSALLMTEACLADTVATVQPLQGTLTINQGQGFKTVNGPVQAKTGDSVVVSPDGRAVIAYADGCKVNVEPGAVATVAPLSPCASGSLAADLYVKAPPMYTKAPPAPPPPPPEDYTALVAMGLITAGAVAAAFALQPESVPGVIQQPSPASP